ncbi:MAG: YfiR family protein [Magnetococcus sp. WYHC-3]
MSQPASPERSKTCSQYYSPLSLRILLAFLCALCCLASATLLAGDTDNDLEYAFKSAVLAKLVRFVEWPVESAPVDTVTLCLAGPDPFGRSLEVLSQKQVKGMRLQVRSLGEAPRSLDGCHLVFFNMDSRSGKTLLERCEERGVLSVGDRPGFLEAGGMVHLQLVERKIQISVNRSAVERSPLHVSALIYQLARVVTDSRGH